MPRLVLLWLFVLLFLPVPGLQSQSASQPLAYGDQVSGSISDSAYAWEYTFSGQVGDVVVIEMRSMDRTFNNPLFAPILLLDGPDGTRLVDTTAAYALDDALLVTELPQSGDYTLIATREGGQQGQASGDFTLALKQLTELSLEQAEAITLNVDEGTRYWTVKIAEPFVLQYHHQMGAYFPDMTVNRINTEEGGLISAAAISGHEMTFGIIGVFTAETRYIIALSENARVLHANGATAAVEITLLPARSIP